MTEKLEQQVIRCLKEKQRTVSTAESCTGGWLAKRLTDQPGSSSVFLGGVVSYSNEMKHHLLHVPQQMLDTYGAVSAQVAKAMAEGVREAGGSFYGIGITGIAGPGSDGTSKPVGLVYVALADEKRTVVQELQLQGDRSAVRTQSCDAALHMILDALNHAAV